MYEITAMHNKKTLCCCGYLDGIHEEGERSGKGGLEINVKELNPSLGEEKVPLNT